MRLTTFSDCPRVLIYLGVHDDQIATVGQTPRPTASRPTIDESGALPGAGWIHRAAAKAGDASGVCAGKYKFGELVRGTEDNRKLVERFDRDTPTAASSRLRASRRARPRWTPSSVRRRLHTGRFARAQAQARENAGAHAKARELTLVAVNLMEASDERG